VVRSPIPVGATSVSGTSTEADGTTIDVYVNGSSVGRPAVTSQVWTQSGLTALVAGDRVKATATASGKLTSRFSNEVTVQVAATDVAEAEPIVFQLMQNYPNPFNPSTVIRYGLRHKSFVQLNIYNALGQRVAQLVNGEVEAGYHEVRFESAQLASGFYFYRLQAGDDVATQKLLLLR
jgi:hypothetical protein